MSYDQSHVLYQKIGQKDVLCDCGYNAHQEQLKQNVYKGQPVWVSEYGGTFWNPDEPGGWGYGKTPESEQAFLERFSGLTRVLMQNPRICGFCYTQLTDIEQEQNGLYKYDRSRKFSDRIYDEIRRVITQTAAIEQTEAAATTAEE